MQWRRALGTSFVIAGIFALGVVTGLHWPVTTVQAQQSGPIQEYRLPNGVLCYTLPAAASSFSCVYGPGLAPAGQS